MPVEAVWLEARYQRFVKAQLVVFCAVCELSMSMTALARQLKISTVGLPTSKA